jgi:hypothetical protein
MTEAEYLDVILAYSETYNAVFNFWLTITFSFLVAFYFMSGSLSSKLRMLLVGLYAIASSIFIVRYFSLVTATGRIIERMEEAGFEGVYEVFSGINFLVLTATLFLMVVGSLIAVIYSISSSRSNT